MKKTISFLLIILTVTIFYACNNKAGKSSQEQTVQTSSVAIDTNKLWIDLTKVNSMMINFGDDENDLEKFLNRQDQETFRQLMYNACYDTLRNGSSAMIKLPVPEYTVVIGYKNCDENSNDWLMIWQENNNIKFKNSWYILPEESKDEAISILEKYRGY